MRKTGILMHISSLPSPYGIGGFGKGAYDFADFLKKAKQTYWQILPVGPTGYRDSPYQSFSTFAGNPYFIDLGALCEAGLLKKSELKEARWDARRVDYGKLYERRFDTLKKAFGRFECGERFEAFCAERAFWLDDYAMFMAIKRANGERAMQSWDDEYRLRDKDALARFAAENTKEISFWKFVQYEFFAQWAALKEYVNGLGIKIIGDLPIYVAADSADVWANPALFDLDGNGEPRFVAGCPPDAFSEGGQLWGNPVYDWDAHARTGYSWWISRLKAASELFDVVRIDHFRGFESFYAIPGGSVDAKRGEWKKACGIALFNEMKKQLGDIGIIAENLGFLTEEVTRLHRETGYPGMNVLEFAFGSDNRDSEHLPHNLSRNTVAYAGTHDNLPIKPWFAVQSERDREYILDYMGGRGDAKFCDRFIRLVHSTRAELSIIQMQDYLGLGEDSRMNAPSTLSGNWQWRAGRRVFTDRLAERIAHLTVLYGRE